MMNKYFNEPIEENDLFYICFLIEKVSRHLHQRNSYVVNKLGYDPLYHLISVANVLHSENSDQVVYDVIEEYGLKQGNFHIEDVIGYGKSIYKTYSGYIISWRRLY